MVVGEPKVPCLTAPILPQAVATISPSPPHLKTGGQRARRCSILVTCALLAHASATANARTLRPLFEPTDLEMEPTGMLDVDLQVGAIRGAGPWRVVLPDFELDVGLLPTLEFDIDGAYAVEGPSSGPFSFDHAAPESLWPSFKVGLFDRHDETTGRAWALGAQLGPKLPVARAAHGVGVETLLLVGSAAGALHTVLNLGGFADPAPDAATGRPFGLEAGLDVEVDLDQRCSLTAELSGVHFGSSDPDQVLATAGLKGSFGELLDLSLVGLWGFLAGGDRYGLLLGISPKFRLFGGKP